MSYPVTLVDPLSGKLVAVHFEGRRARSAWFEVAGIRRSVVKRSTSACLHRRAYSPVLRQADLPTHTIVPWWGNHPLC